MGGHSPSAPPQPPQAPEPALQAAERCQAMAHDLGQSCSWGWSEKCWGLRGWSEGCQGGLEAGARGAGGLRGWSEGCRGGLRDWGKLCLALRCLWSGCCGADASGRAGDPPSHAGFSQPCYHRRCQWAAAAGLVALTLPACAPCRQLWLIATHGRNCAATITPDSQKMRTGAAQPGSVVLALHTSEKQSDLQIFTFK